MRVVVSGATGFIGTPLVAELENRGDEVVRLVRSAPRRFNDVPWTPGQALDPAALEGVDVVINLAGASISRIPWTRKYRREIWDSRIRATRTIVDALHANPGARLVNASAVGFYGDRGNEELTEDSPAGRGFLADVTRAWEEEALRAQDVAPVSMLRTGVVIGDGGALTPLRLLTSLAVGGRLGSGQQWWPWISLHDEVRAIMHAADTKVEGPINVSGPTPATMNEIGRTLARVMHRPYWFPAPAFAISTLLGAAGKELLLSSQRVVPQRLSASGFDFEHPTVADAIGAVFAA